MNKKGFTLIELLAVIIILGVVMLIGTVSINGVRDKINKGMFETKLELALGAARSWGQDNRELLDTDTNVTVGQLIASGDLTTDEKMEFENCETANKDGSDCRVVTNNMDGTIINELDLKVYLEYGRVYACIIKNEDNKKLLKEDRSWNVFANLKSYCN